VTQGEALVGAIKAIQAELHEHRKQMEAVRLAMVTMAKAGQEVEARLVALEGEVYAPSVG
jgi:hypothetical protein